MSISINSASGYIAPSTAIQSGGAPAVNSSDPDGDGDGGGKRAHKGHRGGHMQQALMQALQSMGLAQPQQPSGSSTTQQTTSNTDSDGDNDGSSSASGKIKADMRQFMHALFTAVKGESATNTAGTTGANTGSPKTDFSAGLAALISQVTSGNAPTDLQNAFSQMTSDLQAVNASTGSAATGEGATANSSPTLQALLSKMQQSIGYGASSLPATGNIVDKMA